MLLLFLPSHALVSHARPSLAAHHARHVQPALVAQPSSTAPDSTPVKPARWRSALPAQRDELDSKILGVMLPSVANLAVIPVVGAVDTFWVGRMGNALALAGQGAANQCFFSTYFLVAFIPTITAPLVARAAGSGDLDTACTRVCEALFLANVLGLVGTLLLALCPGVVLGLVLQPGAPALAYATSYLRLRSLSLIPALVASIGFAAFRGLLDTVTPLKVSLASNLLNLVLDPLLIFGARLGVAGAALATTISEVGAGLLYVRLLLRQRLMRLGALLRPPSLAALVPLIRGGFALLLRQMALNVAFVSATRRTQAMDATGVSAAAYAISNQLYSLGVVVMLAVQATGATLVPAALAADANAADGGDGPSARASDGASARASVGASDAADADADATDAADADAAKARRVDAARQVADRLIGWSTLIATTLAALQAVLAPVLAPRFSPLPEVQEAVRLPALVSAVVQLTNGPLFAGEGIMMGVGAFGPLALLTGVGVGVMVALIAYLPKSLGVSSVWLALLGFHAVQLVGTMYHHLRLSPLARVAGATEAEAASCVLVPGGAEGAAEVCVTEPSA